MDAKNSESFSPVMVMWLTLPGAAMCSIPIGIWLVPRLLSSAGLSMVPVFSGGNALVLVLIPVAAITSRVAYKRCISTTGYPGIRMVLMIFNFITRGIAEFIILFYFIVAVLIPAIAKLLE
jgi:hypothetical protein